MLFFGAVLLAAVAVPVLASPIVAFNKRSTGLSVELSTVSGTEVKAVLTNTGGESLTLLNFGSFMDANPVQKVAVYKDGLLCPPHILLPGHDFAISSPSYTLSRSILTAVPLYQMPRSLSRAYSVATLPLVSIPMSSPLLRQAIHSKPSSISPPCMPSKVATTRSSQPVPFPSLKPIPPNWSAPSPTKATP